MQDGFRVSAAGLLVLACVLLACAGLGVGTAHAQEVENGVYEVSAQVLQASKDELSMCDGAFADTAKLTVKGASASVQLELQPIDVMGIKGYLGIVEHLPGWKGGSAVSAAAAAKRAQVVSKYAGIRDAYNKPGSKDVEVRGVEYPKEVAIPWSLSESMLYLRVYVPAMNDIVAGNGWQVVRLKLDYSTLKRVGDVEEDERPDDFDPTLPLSLTRGSKQDREPGLDSNPQPWAAPDDETEGLVFEKLADGDYTVMVTVLKTDRSSASMADAAVSHEAGLSVRGGKYRLTLSLGSVSVGGRPGYLKNLRYYKAGYGGKSGVPTGETGACEVVAYQLSDGSRVVDAFGTDYPAKVRVPLIDEAKADGYVPLKAFVPAMESIAAGTGTQSMYLKIDRSSVASGAPKGSSGAASAVGGDRLFGASGGSVLAGSTLPGATGLTDASTLLKSTSAAQSAPAADATSGVGSSAAGDRKPPLQGALVPFAATSGAVAFAGVGSVLFRRRGRLLGVASRAS